MDMFGLKEDVILLYLPYYIYNKCAALQKTVHLLYNISKEYNLEITTKRRKYLASLERLT